ESQLSEGATLPTLKRNVAGAPKTTGFESYDGPELPKQNKMYRGRIDVARLREASTGTQGFNLLVVLEAEKGSEDAKYDGYPAWVDIWLADKEPNQAREAAFYRAVGVSEAKLESGDIPISHDDIDDGGKIKKVGGKNPIGAIVKVDMRTDKYGDEVRMKGDAVWPVKKAEGKSAVEEEPDEADLEDATDADEMDPEEREEELRDMKLPELRRIAKAYDIETRGKKLDGLVEAILEAEYPEDEEETEEEQSAEDLYAEVKKLTLPNLRKWALENGDYDKADLKDLSKDDILEMLVD